MKLSWKKILCLTICMAAALLVLSKGGISHAKEVDIQGFSEVFEGSGSREDPYRISSYEQLLIFRELVNAGEDFEGVYFAQTEDIDIGSENWTPIGQFVGEHYFAGIYDGRGHAIRHLTIRQDYGNEYYAGLFFLLKGTVVNLKLTDVDIQAANAGTIAAFSDNQGDSAIINCFVSGKVTAYQAGGICLNFENGSILNCGSMVEFHSPEENQMKKQEIQDFLDAKTGGITLISTTVRVFHCLSVNNQTMPMASYTSVSHVLSSTEEMTEALYWHKWNLDASLARALFGKIYSVDILPNTYVNEAFPIGYQDSSVWFDVMDFMNDALVPLITLIILLSLIVLVIRKGMEEAYAAHEKGMDALTIFSGILSLFLDMAVIRVPSEYLNFFNLSMIVLVNISFILLLFIVLPGKRFFVDKKENGLFIGGAVLILAFSLPQFSITPLYDASIYYGSLTKAIGLYRLDLFTFIGAFVCWKWIHGSALLIAPFEFIFRGNMTGLYISNVIILLFTYVLMFRVLQMVYKRNRPFLYAAGSIALIFCPYQMGLFTYLSWDNYIVYYTVWLTYAYLKKNPCLVILCGFLMSFTKITGMAFYTAFVVMTGLTELVISFSGKEKVTIRPLRMLLYASPVILYLLSMVFGDHFTIQQFFGSEARSLIDIKETVSYLNTMVQGFIFGFRWLFTLGLILTVLILILGRRSLQELVTQKGLIVLSSIFISGIGCICLLLLYNGDAECPRYTAFMNIVNMIWLPLMLLTLFRKERVRNVAAGFLSLLMIIQTVFTIDPSILLHKTGISTGKMTLYRLALDEDDRLSMNLGTDFSEHAMVGDIYAYNLEYTFYDSLIKDMLKDIEEPGNQNFYILDVAPYEMHLTGNQYPMVWNSRLGKMNYDLEDPDGVYLSCGAISDTSVLTGEAIFYFNYVGEFYLIIPGRVPYEKEVEIILADGFQTDGEKYYSNLYGEMRVYHFYK